MENRSLMNGCSIFTRVKAVQMNMQTTQNQQKCKCNSYVHRVYLFYHLCLTLTFAFKIDANRIGHWDSWKKKIGGWGLIIHDQNRQGRKSGDVGSGLKRPRYVLKVIYLLLRSVVPLESSTRSISIHLLEVTLLSVLSPLRSSTVYSSCVFE